MREPRDGPPHIRPRQSLSGRLWLLTTLAVLLSEIVVFLPLIAHERSTWLTEHIDDASLIALVSDGRPINAELGDRLLKEWDAVAVRLADGAGVMQLGDPRPADASVDLGREDLFNRVRRALRALASQGDGVVHVAGRSNFTPDVQVELWLHTAALNRALLGFASDFAVLALVIAGVTGAIVYLAVLVLLVRPMRRLTGSIVAFRADPERTTPLNPSDVTVLPDDEMAIAGQELAAMQHELRTALWRNARLAGLGTVVAKVSHDLRGILTPALLTAERLQLNRDPRVQRAGEVLAQAVDRATDLVRRTLEYAREGPPLLELGPVALAPLVNEAAETARPLGPRLRLENTIDDAVLVRADRIQLFRVLTNLLRNAAEAGAQTVRVSARHKSPTLSIEIADDGPGLPEAVRADLFRPFAGTMQRGGSGLGLAIARDLMVAHGGSIELVSTGADGTAFRLTLRLVEAPQPTDRKEQDRLESTHG
jgi:signal transduction histidine kinase